MMDWIIDLVVQLPGNIEWTMNHMSVLQWAVVSVTVVVVGFLALKSQRV